jgi:hypothetical protein
MRVSKGVQAGCTQSAMTARGQRERMGAEKGLIVLDWWHETILEMPRWAE